MLRPRYTWLKYILMKPLMTTGCGEVGKGVLGILLKAILGEMCLSSSSHGHEENYGRLAHFFL